MNVEESSSNMRFMIASAAIGALVAGLGFYLQYNIFVLSFQLHRKKCVTHEHDDALEKLKCKLEKFKRAAFKAQIEIKYYRDNGRENA